MKYCFLLAVLVVFTACKKEVVKKPENLIPQDRMSDILYDIAILNAAKSTNSEVLERNNIDADTYIFNKYGVDSLQFAQNSVYYASKPDIHAAIFKKVEERLKTLKDSISEVMRQNNLKAKNKLNRQTNNMLEGLSSLKGSGWRPKNMQIENATFLSESQTETFIISRISDTSTAYLATTKRVQTAIGSKYTFKLKVRPTKESRFFGMRLQGNYPERCDALFDLKKGVVTGQNCITFEGVTANIENTKDGWLECSITAKITRNEVSLIFGTSSNPVNIQNWEAKFADKSTVEVSNPRFFLVKEIKRVPVKKP